MVGRLLYRTNIIGFLKRKYCKINDSIDRYRLSDSVKLYMNALQALRENLFSNTVNAGATITDAHYEMREYCLVVTIIDNGHGMYQGQLDKIILSQHGDGVYSWCRYTKYFKND
jgi:hypothetical protein